MSSRLDELHRQRALLQDHLSWLEREIAAETPDVAATPAVAPTSVQVGSARLSPAQPPVPAVAPATALATATTANATVATPGNVVAPAVPPAQAGLVPPPEAILDQYRIAPDTLRNDIRKGCFVYFALAFVLLGIGVGGLYLFFRF